MSTARRKARSSNSLTKTQFLLDHLVYILVAFIWFKGLLFRSIGFQSRADSAAILWTLIISLSIVGFLLTQGAHRNHLSLFCNICIPFGIYTFITYFHNFPILWTVAILLAVIIGCFYCWLVMSQDIKQPQHAKEIRRKRLIRCFFGTRTILAVCMAAIILLLGARVVFGGSLTASEVDPEPPTQEATWTVANKIDTVLLLQEEEWVSLSTREKLSTMQTVANIEANYLGLPHELNVTLGALHEDTLAQYGDVDHTITLNIDYFDTLPAEDTLNSLCHEAYHAYQHRLCDAYDSVDEPYKNLLAFGNVPEYKREFANYVGDTETAEEFMAYYEQACEAGARSYAKDAVADYYNRILLHRIESGEISAPEETNDDTNETEEIL